MCHQIEEMCFKDLARWLLNRKQTLFDFWSIFFRSAKFITEWKQVKEKNDGWGWGRDRQRTGHYPPALKLTWGLLKLQPDIRLDKDARKGHYVATRDSIPLPLPYFTRFSLFPTLNLSGVQWLSVWGAPWMRVSERSPQICPKSQQPSFISLHCPSLFLLSLTLTRAHARSNPTKLSYIFSRNTTLTSEELLTRYQSAPKSLDGFPLK